MRRAESLGGQEVKVGRVTLIIDLKLSVEGWVYDDCSI